MKKKTCITTESQGPTEASKRQDRVKKKKRVRVRVANGEWGREKKTVESMGKSITRQGKKVRGGKKKYGNTSKKKNGLQK